MGSGAGGGISCCRWFCCVFIVIINVLSIIVGALLAILGAILLWGYAVIKSTWSSYLDKINESFKEAFGSDFDFQSYFNSLANITGSAAGVLIGFGIILIIISCIGCIGACIANPACLVIYMVCVGLLLIGQLIVVIIWFADSSIFKRGVRDTMNQQVDKFTGEKNSNFETITLNLVHVLVGCCGVANGSDFARSEDWNRNYTINDTSSNTSHTITLKYPVSCCKFNPSTFAIEDKYCPYNGTEASPPTSNYNVGCYSKIFTAVESYMQINSFFYALAGLLGLELLLILGATLIYCAQRKQQKSGGGSETQYKMHHMT